MNKAELHKKISYWKSGLRLVGYCFLPLSICLAAAVLLVSEGLGVAEEFWGA